MKRINFITTMLVFAFIAFSASADAQTSRQQVRQEIQTQRASGKILLKPVINTPNPAAATTTNAGKKVALLPKRVATPAKGN